MRRTGVLFAAICLMLTAVFLPASAADDEVFSMDVVLSDDQQDWAYENVIFVTDDKEMTYEFASAPECGVVISFRLVGESLRVGAREPTCSGLQVRKDIPLTDVQNNRLHIVLTYAKGKYMLYVDGTAINDRNWNTVCPDGMTEEEWKTTDNIALCTDYSRLENGGMEDEDGEMAFLMQDISNRQLYIQSDDYASFQLENVEYGYAPAENPHSEANSAGNPTQNSSQDTNGGAAIPYIVGGAAALVLIAVAIGFVVLKKRASAKPRNQSNQ